jgi:uncharacterized protein (TIGR02145 family)
MGGCVKSLKILFASFVVVAGLFLVACDDDGSSASPQDEDSLIEASSSSGEEFAKNSSSSRNDNSSCSVKSSSSSAKSSSSVESSSSITLATPCKTESEDNCEYGELVDERDGQVYRTVKIGDQWWMAENLNFETDNSFCYKESAKYCEMYGRLYQWSAALDSVGAWSANGKGCGYDVMCSLTYPVRGVCPEGWHLPDTTEWNTLITAVGEQSVAGIKLKSTSGWYSNGNGKDDFGFSALPAGFRQAGNAGSYFYEGSDAFFWSSTGRTWRGAESNIGIAYFFSIHSNSDVEVSFWVNFNRLSVRCLKD